MANFLTALEECSKGFTKSQKKISEYFIDNINDVAFYTLEEVASRIGVSTTTVIRFGRALGYQGFTDMQKDIQSGLQQDIQEIQAKSALPERITKNTVPTSNTLLQQSFQNDIINLENTLSILNDEDLKKTVTTISNAPNIYILGFRGSFSAAFYLASRLSEIRENVRLVQSVGMIYPEELISAHEGDICIAFLFPRYSKITTTMLAWLRSEGVKVILITSEEHTAISGYGDIILPCYVNSISYKNSFVAPLALCNYLIAAVTQENFEESQRVLEKTETLLSQGYYLGL